MASSREVINQRSDVGGLHERVAGTTRQELVEHLGDKVSGNLLVGLCSQVRCLRDVSGLGLVEAESTGRGRTVGEVDLDSEDTLGVRSARSLEEACLSVWALAGSEQEKLMLALGQVSGVVLLVSLDISQGSSVENGLGIEWAKCLIGLERDREDRVVFESFAHGQVDPLVTSRDFDTALDGGLDLSRTTDSGVPKDTGSGQSTRSQDDTAVGLDGNDLRGVETVATSKLDTSDLAAVANKAHDLRSQAKFKVGTRLREWQVSAQRSSAHLVLDVPGWVAEDLVLCIRIFDHVDRLEAKPAQDLGE